MSGNASFDFAVLQTEHGRTWAHKAVAADHRVRDDVHAWLQYAIEHPAEFDVFIHGLGTWSILSSFDRRGGSAPTLPRWPGPKRRPSQDTMRCPRCSRRRCTIRGQTAPISICSSSGSGRKPIPPISPIRFSRAFRPTRRRSRSLRSSGARILGEVRPAGALDGEGAARERRFQIAGLRWGCRPSAGSRLWRSVPQAARDAIELLMGRMRRFH